MLYLLYCIAHFLAKVIPLRLGYAIAVFIAKVYSFFSKKDKRALRSNLRIILGPAATRRSVERCVSGVFKNFGRYLVDFLKVRKIDEDFVRRFVEIEGIQHLDRCLSKGKGVIIVTAHLGNWELGGGVVAAKGYPMNGIVLEHRDRRINDLFMRRRSHYNMKPIPLGMSLRGCFKALRANEIVAIVGDKDYTGDSELVEFFGREACFPKGAAVLSLKTGAPIVVSFVIRKHGNRFKLVMEKPAGYGGGGSRRAGVKDIMRSYLAVFEKYIKRYPDQWYAFEEIWERHAETR